MFKRWIGFTLLLTVVACCVTPGKAPLHPVKVGGIGQAIPVYGVFQTQ